VVLKTGVMSEWRKLFEAKDSDLAAGCQPQVPRIWERETTDPKPTVADHDQSR